MMLVIVLAVAIVALFDMATMLAITVTAMVRLSCMLVTNAVAVFAAIVSIMAIVMIVMMMIVVMIILIVRPSAILFAMLHLGSMVVEMLVLDFFEALSFFSF